jgi:hypothetical protein
MFEDDESGGADDRAERPAAPEARAKEKADEFRMHAELAAVFEGTRKFDAVVRAGLDADVARDVQRAVAKFERSTIPDTPVLNDEVAPEAARVLDLPAALDLTTNDYHVHRRPGEAMVVRWLAGDEVEAFYARLQAHFDAALEGFKEDERQALEWKQDEGTAEYLKAVDAIEVRMAERYARDVIRTHNVFVLSTQTADEININYLAQQIMNLSAAELVGGQSAPPDDGPTDRDLAWFFKLFSLRGVKDGVEQMCFFTFLQKTDDTFGGDGW